MDFTEKEKKIFFDVIKELTGHGDFTRSEIGLTESQIIKRVGAKITIKRASELFTEYTSQNNIYLASDTERVYRIADAGQVFYKHLIEEEAKANDEKNLLKSNIKSGKWTRSNIVIGIIIGSVTLLAVLTNVGITIYREWKEQKQQSADSLKQLKINQSASEQNKELHQISLSLKDTSTKKVKIVK